MTRISKKDVEAQLLYTNQIIPQPNKIHKREIKGDHWPAGGGWKFFYYNERGYGREINSHRYTNKEALTFLQGVSFGISNIPKQ